jgi:hypothetical protein
MYQALQLALGNATVDSENSDFTHATRVARATLVSPKDI